MDTIQASNPEPASAAGDAGTSQPTTPTTPAPSEAGAAPAAAAAETATPPTPAVSGEPPSAGGAAEASPSGPQSETEKRLARLTQPKAQPKPQPADLPPAKADADAEDEEQELPEDYAREHPRAAKAFHAMRQRLKKARDMEPAAKAGKAFIDLVHQHQLGEALAAIGNEGVARAMALEAALTRSAAGTATRADVALIEQAMQRAPARLDPAKPEKPAEKPALPEDLQMLVETGDLQEAEARLLSEARQGKDPAAAKRQPVAPRASAPASPVAAAASPEAQARELSAYNRMLAEQLVGDGVPVDRIEARVSDVLMPKVYAALAPDVQVPAGMSPAQAVQEAFLDLPPKARFDLVLAAHEQVHRAVTTTSPPVRRAPHRPMTMDAPAGTGSRLAEPPSQTASRFKRLTGAELH